MSSFFTLPASQRKRKRQDRTETPASKKRGATTKGRLHATEPRNRRRDKDGSISGSESEDGEGLERAQSSGEEASGSESDEVETVAERRLRLAEIYLKNIREEVNATGFDAADIDRDLIAERLREDAVCSHSVRSLFKAHSISG
jgi:ribosomal RNA-processing protein 9